jgi:chromate reductase, NAD(P)H dehydrogenase (quinone)
MDQETQAVPDTINKQLRVVGFSGSLRKESFNRKALQIAKKFAVEAGTMVEEIDLKELSLPLYDADIEAKGFPESVQILRRAVETADVVLIASPEYNHSISGALKNAIDWLSTGKNTLDGKIAAIFGASSGLFGTVRGQFHLRQILAALNVFLVPQPQVFIRSAREAFDQDGSLKDKRVQDQLKTLINKTLHLAKALKSIHQ